MVNLNWLTQMRWLEDGVKENRSRIWIMINYQEHCATTTIRILWQKYMGKDMPTNLTSLVLHRRCNRLLRIQLHINISKIFLCQRIIIIRRNSILWTLRFRPPMVFLHLVRLIGVLVLIYIRIYLMPCLITLLMSRLIFLPHFIPTNTYINKGT